MIQASDPVPERILNAAGEIFAERGFEMATVREICRRAKANVAAINYYFGDKRKLYVACLAEACRQRDALLPIPSSSANLTAEERLREQVLAVLRRLLEIDDSSWAARLTMREMLDPSDVAKPVLEQSFRPHFDRLLEIISQLLPPDADEDLRLKLAYNVVSQSLFYRTGSGVIEYLSPGVLDRPAFSCPELADSICTFVIAAAKAHSYAEKG